MGEKHSQQRVEIEIQMRKHLAESAFEFLQRAIFEFQADDLKFSVIHFCSAAEQFLEHFK